MAYTAPPRVLLQEWSIKVLAERGQEMFSSMFRHLLQIRRCRGALSRPSPGWPWVGAALAAGVGVGAAVAAARRVSVPDGVRPVSPFDLDRYLGKWFELARIEHRFERGLSDTTARYSLRHDGSVTVTNRGYNAQRGRWEESVGKAVWLDDAHTGALKVSFFWPVYRGYNVVYVDDAYETALVIGERYDYFWLLSRKASISDERYRKLIGKAGAMGVDVRRIVRVTHT